MSDIAKKHTDRLEYLKKSVEQSQQYFADNVKRYEQFMKFVFKSSLDDMEMATLADRGMPTIEFNILESFISRQRGQFAKQEPSIIVRAADGIPIELMDQQLIDTINLVESHLRYEFSESQHDMRGYNILSDLMGGGFAVSKIYTDYMPRSFEQKIHIDRVSNPTLCGFDPLAMTSHKGDGRFCFEIYPLTKDGFEKQFGTKLTESMKFSRSLSGFDWSFQNEQEEIVLVADYFEKKCKKETILKLSNGHVVTEKEYEQLLDYWEKAGLIEQPPIVLKKRKADIENIMRYRFCEADLLDVKETDFRLLPLIFGDGNSVYLKDGAAYTQVTRPYVYHAMGIQRLKNFAGQSLANELENMIQHKFIVALESIPTDYQSAYQNVQKADTLIYNHFLDTNNPNVILPPPREVARTPIPPQITEAFRMSDEMTQFILGNYDMSTQVNSNKMSGIAFQRSSMQSDNSVMPYIVGYNKMVCRECECYLDLLPKYYRTPRTLPVLGKDGKRSYMEINKKGSVYMNYDPNHLQVQVEPGVNFEMQKEIALQSIVQYSQAMPIFADFFGKKGLRVFLDNVDFRGSDTLKEKVPEYEKELEQAQAMQQQQMQQQQAVAMQQVQRQMQSPTIEELAMMELQEKSKVDAANVAIKERDSETKFLELMNKIRSEDVEREIKLAEIDAENTRSAVDSAINISKHLRERQTEELKNKEP